MLTGRQIASMIYAFFNINDVQERATDMNDMLNIKLRNVKIFDRASEQTLMAMKNRA